MNMPATTYPTRCPLLSADNQTCLAKGRGVALDANRLRRSCQSDNFDSCPTLLTFLLLHSQSKSSHCPSAEFQAK